MRRDGMSGMKPVLADVLAFLLVLLCIAAFRVLAVRDAGAGGAFHEAAGWGESGTKAVLDLECVPGEGGGLKCALAGR
jgi:hypothetical protein